MCRKFVMSNTLRVVIESQGYLVVLGDNESRRSGFSCSVSVVVLLGIWWRSESRTCRAAETGWGGSLSHRLIGSVVNVGLEQSTIVQPVSLARGLILSSECSWCLAVQLCHSPCGTCKRSLKRIDEGKQDLQF